MDELDGHRAFADRGGAALGRSGPHVAGGEDAGDAGLEQVLGVRRGAGEDEAVGVARDGVVEPFSARAGAEEEEQERERELLAACQGDGLEVPVRAMERGDLAAVADGDAVAIELVDRGSRTSSRAGPRAGAAG